jgi:hypothetical protein
MKEKDTDEDEEDKEKKKTEEKDKEDEEKENKDDEEEDNDDDEEDKDKKEGIQSGGGVNENLFNYFSMEKDDLSSRDLTQQSGGSLSSSSSPLNEELPFKMSNINDIGDDLVGGSMDKINITPIKTAFANFDRPLSPDLINMQPVQPHLSPSLSPSPPQQTGGGSSDIKIINLDPNYLMKDDAFEEQSQQPQEQQGGSHQYHQHHHPHINTNLTPSPQQQLSQQQLSQQQLSQQQLSQQQLSQQQLSQQYGGSQQQKSQEITNEIFIQ